MHTGAEEAHVVHALPGRLRVHLPDWPGRGRGHIEKEMRRVRGVRRVEANPLTRNVLVSFDPGAAEPEGLLGVLRRAARAAAGVEAEEELPPAVKEKQPGGRGRARVAVRGLDRDPQLGRRVVERLEARPGVLVEYDEALTALEELLADVSEVELAPLPGETRPAHPLDPRPLWQGILRTAGAALGLGLLAARRLSGATGPAPGARAWATSAAVIALLRSFPSVRTGLRRLLGANTADMAFNAAGMVTLTLANSPLGLALLGVEAVALLRAVRANRSAWRHYEQRFEDAPRTEAGAVVRLQAGERAPRRAEVLEGFGTALGRDGLPLPLVPGSSAPAGARLAGGPFLVRLEPGEPFLPGERPAPLAPTFYTHYLRSVGLASLGYAGLTAVVTRSFARTFIALVLVNARTALIGAECANFSAAARALRCGATLAGTRRERAIRRPDALLLDGPRVLTDGVEVTRVLPLVEGEGPAEWLAVAAGVSGAAGSPWGNAFPRAGSPASEGHFDGSRATATVSGVPYALEVVEDPAAHPQAESLRRQGNYLLLLSDDRRGRPVALLVLRPRLAPGVAELVEACRARGVFLALLPGEDPDVSGAVARRAGVPLLPVADATRAVRAGQRKGTFIALVSDSAEAAEAFDACDLAIGLSSGRSGRFPARADLLAPDLAVVAAVVEAGARRDLTVRDSVLLSGLANVAGAFWGFGAAPDVRRASLITYLTALASVADGWVRQAGGKPSRSSLAYLVDPRPERWGHADVATVLSALKATPDGLTSREAARRRRRPQRAARRHEVWKAVLEQVRYPTTGILAGAAGLSLFIGHPLDFAVIGGTIALNVAVGVWQERQAGRAAEALSKMGAPAARVLRDRRPVTVPAGEVVPGDVLLLAPGDRVPADARLLEADGLEVDEASLTGESLPVGKSAGEGAAEARVVLDGSDVVVGTGRAVVVGVGRQTRMGAVAAALAASGDQQSPLGQRLGRLLWQSVPLTAAAGGAVVLAGLAHGRPPLAQLALGATLALAAVPEGLPLLSGMGQASAARRLARRNALVRRLTAVEALGRVDVVCADKTGTMTQGRLSLRLVSDPEREADWPGELAAELRAVLEAGALASPHPEAVDARAHPTDVAIVRGAEQAGLHEQVRAPREDEARFDPVRGFHAALVAGRLCLKGAPEAVAPRCERVRRRGNDLPLDEEGRRRLLARAQELAGRGLRVLMVAEGPAGTHPDDPEGLTALGFLGISDPLRPGVAGAVRRCRDAGVRVVMITGDHPVTARTIAREAGLLDAEGADGAIVTGPELGELQNGELDRRLERAVVIARATPLEKLRIIEGLQRRGHAVAMTGDGVNDAPALRLADVGVAMGRGGTEVARQAADVVLADDDFATLVEAVIEGRSFWQNIRRSLGLLLGGNLGEMGLIVGTTALGLRSPLTAAQILVVNLITDALPALSVVTRGPEHRELAGLAREGLSALDTTLRTEVLRRGTATGLPAVAAYLLARGPEGPERAGAVAFGSIVATQLAQTMDAGRTGMRVDGAVLGAVAGSAGMLLSALTVPPLRNLLGLALPGPLGWALMGGSAAAAVALSRALAALAPARPALPAPADASDNAVPHPAAHERNGQAGVDSRAPRP